MAFPFVFAAEGRGAAIASKGASEGTGMRRLDVLIQSRDGGVGLWAAGATVLVVVDFDDRR